jgi:hypothetical protein
MKIEDLEKVNGIKVKKSRGKARKLQFDTAVDANNIALIKFKINSCLHYAGANKVDARYGDNGFEIKGSGFSLVNFF